MRYKQGDKDACIADVKRRLSVFPVDSDFDQALAERVRGIQMVSGIPVTGVLDVETAEAAGVAHLLRERAWT